MLLPFPFHLLENAVFFIVRVATSLGMCCRREGTLVRRISFPLLHFPQHLLPVDLIKQSLILKGFCWLFLPSPPSFLLLSIVELLLVFLRDDSGHVGRWGQWPFVVGVGALLL